MVETGCSRLYTRDAPALYMVKTKIPFFIIKDKKGD